MDALLLELPTGYHLERDSGLLILRRPDGSMVAAFNAWSLDPETVRWAAQADDMREAPEAVPAQPGSLWARFFGRFELLCDGGAISLGRNQKALALLKYLLANRSRPVSQDYLMGWLWPESNLKKARWSLNSAVYTLRKILGSCATTSTNYVLLDEGYYHLCPTLRVSTDTDEFCARYERGRRAEKAGRMSEAAGEYKGAARLYRDVYLIEDLYEDWTMIERERLTNLYMGMLDRLAGYYKEAGQYRESISTCYSVLDKDRCHEDSYKLLIECYIRLGLRGEALRQYRLCERILVREYGVNLSPDTQALYTSLLEKPERARSPR